MKNYGTYELKTIEPLTGIMKYYYFYTWRTVRTCKLQKPIPDKMRILIEDREEELIEINLLNPITYFYRKYIKVYFTGGERVNWEKEGR